MKTIDLQTTHNVLITKQLASVPERVGAFLLDFMFMWILFYLFFSIFGFFILYDWMGYFLASFLLFFYSLLSEVIGKGMSLGKRIVGIKVVRLDGANYTFTDAVSRWSMRFIDFYMSLGTLAMITIGTSLNGQRLGDKMANTTVIKSKDSNFFSLNDIAKLKNNEAYESNYPTVTRLSDEDVLVIKKTLKRVKAYNTENNNKIFQDLVDRVGLVLGLDKPPANKEQFLREVIRDYIALTR